MNKSIKQFGEEKQEELKVLANLVMLEILILYPSQI
jgi:hypothetical protein